jgi:HSP20 family molecular chaperone IbpA
MTDSIRNKNADRAYIREVQQEKNLRKQDLSQKEREEIKAVKEYYAKERKSIDQESAAAINHIKEDQTLANQEEREIKMQERREQLELTRQEAQEKAAARQEASESASTYNRKGQLQTTSAEKKKLLIQNYQTPETDSFYQVQDRGSRVSEDPSGYYIEAYVPEHEKDNVRLSITPERAVLSGKRKFNDVAEADNKSVATNNFQTFREEFKFTRPVTSEGMTREREGDYIRFFIPKLEAFEFDESSS